MAALPLVTPGADGQLEVGSDAAELLSSLNGPLCVIAFTGKPLCAHKPNEVVFCHNLPTSASAEATKATCRGYQLYHTS